MLIADGKRLLARAMFSLAAPVLALSTWLLVTFTFDMQEQRTRIATGIQVLQTRCGPIEFAKAGQGPLVLIAHDTGVVSIRASVLESTWRGVVYI